MENDITETENKFFELLKHLKKNAKIWDEYTTKAAKMSSSINSLKSVIIEFSKAMKSIGYFFYTVSDCKDLGSTIIRISSNFCEFTENLELLANSLMTDSSNSYSNLKTVLKKEVTPYDQYYGEHVKVKINYLKDVTSAISKMEKNNSSKKLSSDDALKSLQNDRITCINNVTDKQKELMGNLRNKRRKMAYMFLDYIKPALKINPKLFNQELIQDVYNDLESFDSFMKSEKSTSLIKDEDEGKAHVKGKENLKGSKKCKKNERINTKGSIKQLDKYGGKGGLEIQKEVNAQLAAKLNTERFIRNSQIIATEDTVLEKSLTNKSLNLKERMKKLSLMQSRPKTMLTTEEMMMENDFNNELNKVIKRTSRGSY